MTVSPQQLADTIRDALKFAMQYRNDGFSKEARAQEALDVLVRRLQEAEAAHAELITAVEAATPGSDWWYDGRDIFHKPAGTNLDQIVIPLPEAWHESGNVSPADARLVIVAVNHARSLAADGVVSGDA